jgi:hypothetical protein
MNEWNIQSRSHACQACGQPFADQQHYHTLLLDLRHEIQRRDLCETCWRNEQGASDRKGFISHWQGVYEVPAAPPEAIQKESAESLLRHMIELNQPEHAAASYILAVMLERKRILKVKEQFRREGHRVFVYEHAKSGDVFTIPDPDLHLNQLEAVQRDVAHLLEHLTPAAAVSPAIRLRRPNLPATLPMSPRAIGGSSGATLLPSRPPRPSRMFRP